MTGERSRRRSTGGHDSILGRAAARGIGVTGRLTEQFWGQFGLFLRHFVVGQDQMARVRCEVTRCAPAKYGILDTL